MYLADSGSELSDTASGEYSDLEDEELDNYDNDPGMDSDHTRRISVAWARTDQASVV